MLQCLPKDIVRLIAMELNRSIQTELHRELFEVLDWDDKGCMWMLTHYSTKAYLIAFNHRDLRSAIPDIEGFSNRLRMNRTWEYDHFDLPKNYAGQQNSNMYYN